VITLSLGSLAMGMTYFDVPASPYVVVTGLCADGWFTSTLSLRGFARARCQLERCDLLFVELCGALA